MKLRLTDSQIRFRIDQNEAEKLRLSQILSESLHLPGGNIFLYQVIVSESATVMELDYAQPTLKVTIPMHEFLALTNNPNQHGINHTYTERDKQITFSLEIDMAKSKHGCC